MTKKGILKRSNEFIEYEEQMLYSVKQRFSKYFIELENLGLAIDIDLEWFYCGDEDFSFSRIEFKEGYICNIGIQIRRKDEPKHDLDLVAITYVQPISQLGMRIFRFGICYSKVPVKIFQEYLDTVENMINEILEKGYDTVCLELDAKKNKGAAK